MKNFEIIAEIRKGNSENMLDMHGYHQIVEMLDQMIDEEFISISDCHELLSLLKI